MLQTMLSSVCVNKKQWCYDLGQKLFDQTIKHNLIIYDSIQKITIIVIDLSNQLALDADPKAIQLILLGI